MRLRASLARLVALTQDRSGLWSRWRLVILVLILVALVSCRSDTARLTFRPDDGARYRYELRVRSSIETVLGGQTTKRDKEETVLHAEEWVLDAPDRGPIRMEVRLRRPGSQPRTFVVRLDRAAQLQQVERIEGLPATVLGELGLSEIFPAAAGAPPDRPLRTGERWVIDEDVKLPGSKRSRLVGEGRLIELATTDGRKLAFVRSHTRLPVTRTTKLRNGILSLRGTQVTESTARHNLADGAVERSWSKTKGTFRMVLTPPPGRSSPPVDGSLSIEVRSEVRRLR